jgi:serine/threonine protein kinase
MSASAPTSYGAYDVVEELGRGSFGWVYKARHRATGAERALKVIKHDDADPAATERFRREAEALARVDGHPNLVRVHEAGVAGRCLYYAMELVQGPSLRSLLKRGPLPPAQAARLGAKVARALAHCHAPAHVQT